MSDDVTDEGSPAETTASILRQRLEQGPIWIEAGGRSMQPTIPPRSEVLVHEKSVPAPGEIWCVVDEVGELVVHRIDREWHNTWILRGDGNDHDDPPVDAARLVGQVRASRLDDQYQDFGRADRWRWRVRSAVRRLPGALARRMPRVPRPGG